MEINWVTVAAQIINFLILVWLLQKFLYGPVTRAMSAREEGIRKRLEDADEARRAANEEANALKTEREDLARQRDELLLAARAEAEALRHSLERDAREKLDQESERWRDLLHAEKKDFLLDVRAQTEKEFFALARKSLKDLANAPLEKMLVDKFIEQLAMAPDSEKEKLVSAALGEKNCGQIQSGFSITQEDQAKLQTAVNDLIEKDIKVDFSQEPELIGGIKLRFGGQKVEWSIAKYLDTLQERLSGLVPKIDQPADRHAAE